MDPAMQAKSKKIERIAPYMWKKGQSGNPAGRVRGKTMKDYARELLECQTEEERQAFLHGIPKIDIWKMAEGNPDNKTDLTSKGEKLTGTVILPSKDVDSLETEPETNNSPQE